MIMYNIWRFCIFLGNEVVVVKTPSFPESVSEGDVRWEKSKCCSNNAYDDFIFPLYMHYHHVYFS